jgi:E3 ubiquitin-protein ligase RNF216
MSDALFNCRVCGLGAEVPAGVKVFACPQAGCGAQTCVECGEESHVPLRCAEVESQKQTGGRLTVEEAMTEAKIRTCPKVRASLYETAVRTHVLPWCL